MLELISLEYMTMIGMTMVLLFLDSRFSKWRTIPIVCSAIVLVMTTVAVLYWYTSFETVLQLYSLVAHIPSLALFLVFSRFRGWRLVFQILSSILFCTLIHHGAGLVYYLSGGRFWTLIVSYVVLTAAVIWFLIRFLRPLLRQALLELRRGWSLMCLMMGAYYVLVIYLIPGYVGITRSSTILKPAVSLLMVGFYSILTFLFSSVRKEAEARYSAQLSALQLSALQSRMEAVRAAENTIRTERHDLRYRLQTVAELVARGDRETALDFLDTAQQRLDDHKAIQWCRPPVLDAVFASYFDQARRQGIRVDAKLSLPDTLPVNEGELAIALANALENAIHANLELPPDQRELRCKLVARPSIMLELANPCNGDVVFGPDGLPVARREGHGLGCQSISAFCRKHGAVCQFALTDGWFRLRLIL